MRKENKKVEGKQSANKCGQEGKEKRVQEDER